MTTEDVLETAHISIDNAHLKVVVKDLRDFKVLFHPRPIRVFDNIAEEDPEWKKELLFPDFVMAVNPSNDNMNLLVWVIWPFDFKELAKWLRSFEKK